MLNQEFSKNKWVMINKKLNKSWAQIDRLWLNLDIGNQFKYCQIVSNEIDFRTKHVSQSIAYLANIGCALTRKP